MLVSSSLGRWRDGLLGAILLRAADDEAMMARRRKVEGNVEVMVAAGIHPA